MASTTANDADYKTALMACMALAGIRGANGDKTRAPPELFYHGKRIISLDDVAAGLHITKKTMRKYREFDIRITKVNIKTISHLV